MTSTLSTKGQLIIPKDIRDHLGWGSGLELEVTEEGGRVVLRPVEDDLPVTELDDLLGCTGYQGPRLSLEDMEAAIAIGARESR